MPSGPRPSPPSRTAKVVFSGHQGATPWANVMWFYMTGSGEISNDDLENMCDYLASTYAGTLLSVLVPTCTLDTTQAIAYIDGGPFDFTFTSTYEGASTETIQLPAQVAACVGWQIAAHYRGGKPRTYLAGVPVTARETPTTWDLGFMSDVVDAATAFHTGSEAFGGSGGISALEHGVVSFQTAGDWRDPPIFRRINGATFDGRIDTQRRRLGRDV